MDSRTIFGGLGNITALIAFLLPARALYKMRLGRSREQSSSSLWSILFQYHAAMISCLLWVLYRDRFMVIINATGFILKLFYLGLFILYTRTFLDMIKHFAIALVELFYVFVLAHVALAFDDPGNYSGLLCAAGNILICVMKLVWATRRPPVSESAASFANGVIWTVYGLIESDIFIWVPNVVECVHGLVQLVIYAIRYREDQARRENEETVITADKSDSVIF